MRRITITIAAVVAAGAMFGAGYGTAHATAHASPAPRPCTFDGGGTIASGDAARTDTGLWVCTDGTLVRVTGYGN